MPTIAQKRCRKCDTDKPLSEFTKHPRMADGYVNHCRECERKRSLEYRHTHIEERRAYDRVRDEAIKNGTWQSGADGRSYSRLYAIWVLINFRCYNADAKGFCDYGGRGIRVCDEWRNDFRSFEAWALANGYADDLEIDRRENDGNYEPGNCRWVTAKVNCRNRRNNRILTAFGESKPISEWTDDDRCAVNFRQLYDRIRRGWDTEVAIITKPKFLRKEPQTCQS